ncbi:MAG: hypothetical protein LH614_18630 [Pyrinomonadaceae bacterium]|nr:hypothetical protein [Pyrinomonadaceae bacterium]
MFANENVVKTSDSLIELLAAQCADLEKLLGLAREETLAAQQGNFLSILDIVSDREKISHRLEAFQQQIAELRVTLGANEENFFRREAFTHAIEIATLTLEQDRQSKLLLTGLRDESLAELKNLEKSHRGVNKYLSAESKGLAYNRNV